MSKHPFALCLRMLRARNANSTPLAVTSTHRITPVACKFSKPRNNPENI